MIYSLFSKDVILLLVVEYISWQKSIINIDYLNNFVEEYGRTLFTIDEVTSRDFILYKGDDDNTAFWALKANQGMFYTIDGS
jgi:hypothetical protein